MAFWSMAPPDLGIIVRVDTHRDAHVAAALTRDLVGHSDTSPSRPRQKGIAGCSSGPVASATIRDSASKVSARTVLAWLAFLMATGCTVIEVNDPKRQTRYARGKSDPVDAEAAARAVLSGEATGLANA